MISSSMKSWRIILYLRKTSDGIWYEKVKKLTFYKLFESADVLILSFVYSLFMPFDIPIDNEYVNFVSR